jgi:hypothetical protein
MLPGLPGRNVRLIYSNSFAKRVYVMRFSADFEAAILERELWISGSR